MPTPAVPAPWITTRWSRSRSPVALTADSTAAATTAAVPCTSSLKVQMLSRYLSRMRWALAAPKSSQWIIACGNTLLAASTNRSMNSSYCSPRTRA